MAKAAAAAFLVCCAVLPASGHEGHVRKPRKVSNAEAHRPSPLPDRIILTWCDDPARTQAVTWRTDPTVTEAFAQIAPATDGPEFVKTAEQVTAQTVFLTSDLGEAAYHVVRFQNLTPKTTYAYRVGDGENWSEWFQFRTASDRPEPFRFVYFGDAQNEVRSLWSRVIREAILDAPDTRFLLHAGDLINRAENDAEWGEWFQAGGWANAMIPNIVTPGNHEYVKGTPPAEASLSKHWRPQFTLPENGPSELAEHHGETAYWIDYQGVRIISLNSNVRQAEQVPWLEKVLRDNPCRWTIVTFHHPLYSAAKRRDNEALRNLWQPVFDEFRVDLVLQGHDHTYARTGLVQGSQLVGTENEPVGATAVSAAGTVYVVSVSGPKMYDLARPKRAEFQRVAEDTQLFQIITIDGDELRYRACTATGRPYDGFTLKKRDGRPNELVEEVPPTPERLRPAQ
jgi:3',5'-cyclic AMP phosphodiesterase CpdA